MGPSDRPVADRQREGVPPGRRTGGCTRDPQPQGSADPLDGDYDLTRGRQRSLWRACLVSVVRHDEMGGRRDAGETRGCCRMPGAGDHRRHSNRPQDRDGSPLPNVGYARVCGLPSTGSDRSRRVFQPQADVQRHRHDGRIIVRAPPHVGRHLANSQDDEDEDRAEGNRDARGRSIGSRERHRRSNRVKPRRPRGRE